VIWGLLFGVMSWGVFTALSWFINSPRLRQVYPGGPKRFFIHIAVQGLIPAAIAPARALVDLLEPGWSQSLWAVILVPVAAVALVAGVILSIPAVRRLTADYGKTRIAIRGLGR
jgi:hypothetical protein